MGSSKHLSFCPDMSGLQRAGEYGRGALLCSIGDILDWCASISRSTRCRAQKVYLLASVGSELVNGVTLVGDGGG